MGLADFTIVLRRLRHPSRKGRYGAGVAVIMRYTLRLLTLDQLARASGLICALEPERPDNPERFGVWPFEIGLWVGKAATPTIMGRKVDEDRESDIGAVVDERSGRRFVEILLQGRSVDGDPEHLADGVEIEYRPGASRRVGPASWADCSRLGLWIAVYEG